MIKTKTPRHWGGGIRQVSPPMLTSRLSNKRGGRTNGCKDFRPSVSKCGRELPYDDCRFADGRVYCIYNFKYSVCSKSNYLCKSPRWRSKKYHGYQTNDCKLSYRSERMEHGLYRNQNHLCRTLVFHNSRLTLKGVA